ncbi:MAG: glutamine-hydrolyzing carbamoyl-phosphate synthase small subunit [Methanosarcinaceae archaeon]
MDAVIGLEDGTIVKGTGFGAEGTVCGELVFTTQYTGYEEALTDPSYKGQILMFTYPMIGNYGVSGERFQSDGVKAEALVVREVCNEPYHHKSTRTIYKLMEDEGVCGISGVDTRMLTIKTREHGAMRSALICGSDDGEEAVRLARAQPEISSIDLISKVTCPEPYRIKSDVSSANDPKHAVVIDLGIKRSILSSLLARGIDVTVVPATTSVSIIEAYEPDLLFISNGPGDPQNAKDAIKDVSELAGMVPIAGICFGNQVISLALGADTYKLKFGHRGANQPVKDLESGIVHITSQNHGFAVDGDSLDGTDVSVTQTNANDGTVEGISHDYLNIFSVQYHPEANPGPMDTEKLFFGKVLKSMGCDA